MRKQWIPGHSFRGRGEGGGGGLGTRLACTCTCTCLYVIFPVVLSSDRLFLMIAEDFVGASREKPSSRQGERGKNGDLLTEV